MFMDLFTLQRDYKEQILKIAEICHADHIRIFGSIVRGEQTEKSDIDFLVHMKPNSGFGIGGLQWRLEELLHCRIDVVSDTSLNPMLKESILKEAVPL
jgi:predicted nucleotidyltransferase